MRSNFSDVVDPDPSVTFVVCDFSAHKEVRPKMAPQAFESMRSAPGNGADARERIDFGAGRVDQLEECPPNAALTEV